MLRPEKLFWALWGWLHAHNWPQTLVFNDGDGDDDDGDDHDDDHDNDDDDDDNDDNDDNDDYGDDDDDHEYLQYKGHIQASLGVLIWRRPWQMKWICEE